MLVRRDEPLLARRVERAHGLHDPGLLDRPCERLDLRPERGVVDAEQAGAHDDELVHVVVARREVRGEQVVAAIRLRVVRHLRVRRQRVAEQRGDRADAEEDRDPPERERPPRVPARGPREPSCEVVHRGGRARPTLERREQLVDRHERQRLELHASPRAELDRQVRHRQLVGRLDDVHEVVHAERGPLVEHLRPELLDVAVDLAEPRGVRVQRLRPLLGEGREHQIGRHERLLSVEAGAVSLLRLAGEPQPQPAPLRRGSGRPWRPGRRRRSRRRGRGAARAPGRRGRSRPAPSRRPGWRAAARAPAASARTGSRASRTSRRHGRSRRGRARRCDGAPPTGGRRSAMTTGTACPARPSQSTARRANHEKQQGRRQERDDAERDGRDPHARAVGFSPWRIAHAPA